ncbi:MAG: type II toxin-antitoxin system death-on-curing family toxin [Acidobacteria bacterium]|nr:type II toxin-antitoxin system death-on-curing family toxin [Acidobacteriota bacterium]MBI3422332.1 type II toxin-antitoxin system death-on-curing family toxin [Acidobacteriota bacterium]
MEVSFPELKNILTFHHKQIERYGGSHGLRDQGALESALAAAQNRYAYEGADLAVCAATYTYHLSQAHAFIDGNKRIAWGAALLFLEMNGVILTVPEAEGEALCLGIADSRISRAEAEQYFAQWITSLA